MPTMPKPTRPKVSRSKNVNRYLRLLDVRNGTLREVVEEKKTKVPPTIKPVPHIEAKPHNTDIPFDGERQVLMCLYLNLLTSTHTEVDIASEFWRCYRHLLENGAIEDLPVRIVDLEMLLEEVARVKAREQLVLDDPPKRH